MIWTPYAHQNYTADRIKSDEYVGPFIDMGMGKTASTLTAIDFLLFDTLEISRPLIIAPKRVAESVWSDEIDKWDHLKHLRLSKILGTEKQRKEAIAAPCDIHIINYENLPWLVATMGMQWIWDMGVFDESSKLKNPSGKRFKAARMIRPKFKKVVILTGSPTPNGMEDLWSQIYLLDQGDRLEKTITAYRKKYFNEGQKQGHVVFNYKLKKADDEFIGKDVFEKIIMERVSDICFSMKAKDYLDLPPCTDNPIILQMPPKLKQQYDIFERDLVLSIENEEEITAMNAAVLTNKLRQFANGAVYAADGVQWHEVHNDKIDALIENMEAANGHPVMVFYQYKSDWARIQKYLKEYKPRKLESDKDIKAWNNGEIQLFGAHPASVSHGLNLQDGGHFLTWFGRCFNLDFYNQGKKRLDRPGQKFPITNSYIMIADTIDEDVDLSLKVKDGVQEGALGAVKAVRRLIDKWKT